MRLPMKAAADFDPIRPPFRMKPKSGQSERPGSRASELSSWSAVHPNSGVTRRA